MESNNGYRSQPIIESPTFTEHYLKNIRLFHLLMYVCVGAVGTASQYIILIFLVSIGTTGPVSASTVGAIVGAIINYILNYRLTFKSSESHAHSAPRYFFVALLGLCINWAAMSVMVNSFGTYYVLSQIISTCMVLMLTFSANAFWTFKSNP
jgi:putative flippase GtrA